MAPEHEQELTYQTNEELSIFIASGFKFFIWKFVRGLFSS